MPQSIQAVSIPPPPPQRGIFSFTVHPGGRALAFHPITPGHLTISLFHVTGLSLLLMTQLMGKRSKLLIEYVDWAQMGR